MNLGETQPRNVVLFSGHMIDALDRKIPRFPPDMEFVAAAAIADVLAEIHTAKDDLAICGAACGGDLLFAEACLARDMRLEIYIPLDEPTFLAKSVDYAGGKWHDRYIAAKAKATLHVAPDELGSLNESENAYERNNNWMLEAAARFGGDRIVFISLWDGQVGDGPGGVEHLLDQARRLTSHICWLDTRKLWD